MLYAIYEEMVRYITDLLAIVLVVVFFCVVAGVGVLLKRKAGGKSKWPLE